jgi:hypothetical protein
MINHISIGVHNPERAAKVLAELWGDATIIPFPPCPNSFIVIANDGKGSAVEITPADTILVPGEGAPPQENFDSATPTEKYEAKFSKSDFVPQYVATHLNLNTHLSEQEVKAIGEREGWRVLTANRGEGLFQLIELWIEDRFMLEVMTPEQTARYVEIFSPESLRALREQFVPTVPPPQPQTTELNLVG